MGLKLPSPVGFRGQIGLGHHFNPYMKMLAIVILMHLDGYSFLNLKIVMYAQESVDIDAKCVSSQFGVKSCR